MATIPDIPTSTRRVGVLPGVWTAPPAWGEIGRTLGDTGRSLAGTAERIGEIAARRGLEAARLSGPAAAMKEAQDRADEREAQYAVAQGVEFLKDRWNGRDVQDTTTGGWRHDPGVADRTWQEMEADGTTPMDEARRIEGEFRDTPAFQNLTPAQRERFERAWRFKSGEFMRSAGRLHLKQAGERIQARNRALQEANEAQVRAAYGSASEGDAEYRAVRDWAALRNWAMVKGSLVENPEVLDDPTKGFDDLRFRGGKPPPERLELWRRELDAVRTSFDVHRAETLMSAAADGQRIGRYGPDAALARARQIVDELSGAAHGTRPDGTPRGTGWLGEQRAENGAVVTEHAERDGSVLADGEPVDFPMLVPGLTDGEREAVVNMAAYGETDEEMYASAKRKAAAHARGRIAAGKSVWAGDGAGPALIDGPERARLMAKADAAARRLDSAKTEAGRRAFDARRVEMGRLELDCADPEKAGASLRALDYGRYERELSEDASLTDAQRVSLLSDYRKLCEYRDRYDADLKAHQAKAAAALERDRSEHGWVREDGAFVPASAFPKSTEYGADREFNEESAAWQNPKTALARLEAARMTGRLSEADYRRWYAYGTMLMDRDAQTWWFRNYGKFNLEGLAKLAYGDGDVGRAVKEARRRDALYSSKEGLYYLRPGQARRPQMDAASFVADTLRLDRDGSEALVPMELLPKVYDTVRRFARAGVDPADAVRAILQPALEDGLRRELADRLSSPDYFRAVVEDFRARGTRFVAPMVDDAAAGRSANWKADRDQAVTGELVRRAARGGDGVVVKDKAEEKSDGE